MGNKRGSAGKMLKYLSKIAANASSIQKIQKDDAERKENFERLKKIQKLLGQADKKNPDTPVPSKMSSLGKSPGQIDKALRDLEIKVQCRDTLNSIIEKIQNSDPVFVASEIVDEIVGQVHSVSSKFAKARPINSKGAPPLRIRSFNNVARTWKERSMILFFVLYDKLGGMDFKLAGKAFNNHATFSQISNSKLI